LRSQSQSVVYPSSLCRCRPSHGIQRMNLYRHVRRRLGCDQRRELESILSLNSAALTRPTMTSLSHSKAAPRRYHSPGCLALPVLAHRFSGMASGYEGSIGISNTRLCIEGYQQENSLGDGMSTIGMRVIGMTEKTQTAILRYVFLKFLRLKGAICPA